MNFYNLGYAYSVEKLPCHIETLQTESRRGEVYFRVYIEVSICFPWLSEPCIPMFGKSL